MTSDDEALVILSRSGDERAQSAHDGNLITFHRVKTTSENCCIENGARTMKILRGVGKCLIIGLAVIPSPSQAGPRLPAFPGAEGFGALTDDAAHPARDVVLRHLRIRPGPEGPQHCNDVDALSIEHANNVVVDHCSLSWDVDETLAIKAAWWNTRGKEYYQATHDITIQYGIISESLNRSRHRAHVRQKGEIGPHSKSLQTDGGANRVTLHHNLVMHGDWILPTRATTATTRTAMDIRTSTSG